MNVNNIENDSQNNELKDGIDSINIELIDENKETDNNLIHDENDRFNIYKKENYFKESQQNKIDDDNEILYQKVDHNYLNENKNKNNCDEIENMSNIETTRHNQVNKTKFDQIIKKQEEILQETESCKEKISLFNEIAHNQINEFNKNSKKYGAYLNLIKNDMFAVDDLIKKINLELNKKSKKIDT